MSDKRPSVAGQPLAVRMMQAMFQFFGPVFPKLMGRLTYRLWFSSHRFNMPRYEREVADGAQKSSLDVNGIPVGIWHWGVEGPKILFLHGWAGRGTQVASFVKPLVKCGYQVISYDFPAHGETPGKRTDIFKLADALSEVLDHIGPVHGVITHSFGAMLLSQVYHDDLEIEKVVLICPPITLDVMVKNFQRLLKIPDEVIDEFMKILKKNYGDDLAQRVSLIDHAQQIQCKVLIVHDEDDEDLLWENSEKLAQKMPDATFLKTQGLGHIKVLYDASVVDEVKDFIN